jgi:hypothetical protein
MFANDALDIRNLVATDLPALQIFLQAGRHQSVPKTSKQEKPVYYWPNTEDSQAASSI